MSKYKGLCTFDIDNHRYIPVEQADGIISDMNYHPEPEEESKEWWTISGAGYLWTTEHMNLDTINDLRGIGNLFETKEEAEKAVKKLKAWKRLRDNGFEFTGWKRDDKHCGDFTIIATDQTSCDDKDLDLLFEAKNE